MYKRGYGPAVAVPAGLTVLARPAEEYAGPRSWNLVSRISVWCRSPSTDMSSLEALIRYAEEGLYALNPRVPRHEDYKEDSSLRHTGWYSEPRAVSDVDLVNLVGNQYFMELY